MRSDQVRPPIPPSHPVGRILTPTHPIFCQTLNQIAVRTTRSYPLLLPLRRFPKVSKKDKSGRQLSDREFKQLRSATIARSWTKPQYNPLVKVAVEAFGVDEGDLMEWWVRNGPKLRRKYFHEISNVSSRIRDALVSNKVLVGNAEGPHGLVRPPSTGARAKVAFAKKNEGLESKLRRGGQVRYSICSVSLASVILTSFFCFVDSISVCSIPSFGPDSVCCQPRRWDYIKCSLAW